MSLRGALVGCLVIASAWCTLVRAQEAQGAQEPPPPKGPAEIIKRAAEARAKQNVPLVGTPGQAQPVAPSPSQAGQAPQPSAAEPGSVPVPPNAASANAAHGGHVDDHADHNDVPVGNDPHANADGAPPLARRPMAKADPSSDVPVGSIRVHVLDANERPVPDAELQLGIMNADSTRKTVPARTGPTGMFVFDQLTTGDRQAYRVNVLYEGAKTSSTPFRLPMDHGYDVVLRRIDTTRDAREIVLYVGATSLELKDERLRVVQQARLVNIGSKNYVFPEAGELIRLPKELLAFQAEEVMTDQHMREEKGEGMRLTGSIPPGEVTLTWGFDVPQTETTAEFTFDMPWITFAYRVLADAAPGMRLEVDGMPAAELHADAGRRFYVTEIVKRVGEPPLRRVHIRVSGIPGPGPMRFVAVGLALVVLGLGVLWTRKQPKAVVATDEAQLVLAQEKERLLARARELEAERARGEIGPEFHRETQQQLEDQLTAVLYEQKRLVTAR